MIDPQREERKAIVKENVKANLANSDHTLADGILCAINDVTDVKKSVDSLNGAVGEITETVSKIHKVIAGDPEFHEEGLIQKQNTAQRRHFEVMEKLERLEGEKIKEIERALDNQKVTAQKWRDEKGVAIDKIPEIEKDIARIMTFGKAGVLLITLLEISLKIFGK